MIVALLLTSCGSDVLRGGADSTLRRRNVQEYYVGSGTMTYLLPQLPEWARYSTSGNCSHQEKVRYLDLEKISQSFSLSYKKSIFFQYSYNMKYSRLRDSRKLKSVSLDEEEVIFYQTSDEIQGGIFPFKEPNYKRIHLIWIDSLLNRPGKIKKIINRKNISLGFPILISMCLTDLEIEKWVVKEGLSNNSVRHIGREILSIYGVKEKKNFYYSVNLPLIFSKKKEVYLFVPKGKKKPVEFNNIKKVRYY